MLSRQELERISEHAYAPGTYTYLDGVMNRLVWEPTLRLTPLWMAPNLITLIGTLIVLASTGFALFQCPNFSEIPSPQICLLLAFADFIYQTLDAIDGKQARRTGSSSPLGQLFDHGCDCIIAGAFIFQLLIVTQAGAGSVGLLIMTLTSLGFFLTNHEEKYTGTLRTSLGHFGVTEMQLCTILIQVVTAYFGPGIWNLLIPGFEILDLKTLLYLSLIGFAVFASATCLWKFLTRGVLLDAVLEWPTVVIAAACAYAVRDAPPLAACLAVNLALTLASVNMIVSTVSGRQFPQILFFSQLPLLVTAVLNHLEILTLDQLSLALKLSAGFSAAEILIFCIRAAWAISEHLGIFVFKLKRN